MLDVGQRRREHGTMRRVLPLALTRSPGRQDACPTLEPFTRHWDFVLWASLELYALKFELHHPSALVAARTSSIVVVPASTRRRPSSNIERIPFSRASRTYSGAPARRTIGSWKRSSSIINSKIAWRPR